MVHAIRSTSRPHPDANRIAGITVAITVNAALLMLLLVPMRAPPPLSLPDMHQTIRWILPKMDPPKPPVPVPVTKAQPKPTSVMTRPQAVTQPVVPPVIVENGSAQAIDPAIVETDTTPSTGTSGVPLPGVRLEYADAPAPTYPRDALREGIQGTVLLRVLVDVDGRPLQVDVQHSSGDRRLDVAARNQVLQHWRFRPAMQAGRAIQAIGLVPIAFGLNG